MESILLVIFIVINALLVLMNMFLIGFIISKVSGIPTPAEVIKGIMESKIPVTMPPGATPPGVQDPNNQPPPGPGEMNYVG